MKKIPTLFQRIYENHKVVGITPNITPGCEEAFLRGTPTVKVDGACCAIIGGKFYKRFDAKKGRRVPEGAIPCCDPDPVTGHWPHWVPVTDGPDDRWFREAKANTEKQIRTLYEGTFEAIGPHFQGNPYRYAFDLLIPHGEIDIQGLRRTYEGVKEFLHTHHMEGIVFWLNGEPACKIKRSDFGFSWPVKEEQ